MTTPGGGTPPDTTMPDPITPEPPEPPAPHVPSIETLGLSPAALQRISAPTFALASVRAKSGNNISNSAAAQQSTTQSGGVTSNNIYFVPGSGTDQMEIHHGAGVNNAWILTVSINVPATAADVTEELLAGDSGLFSVAVTGGTVYGFAEAKGRAANNRFGARLSNELKNVVSGDWLAAGWWAWVPDDDSAAIALGAFATRQRNYVIQYPDVGGTGAAVYVGNAAGFLLGADSLAFTGRVSLDADFGADTISGVVDNIMNVETDAAVSGLEFSLEAANINNRGFFRGVLSSGNSDSPRNDISGSWGGNFTDGDDFDPGVTPVHAVGTFGGKDGSSNEVLIGSFITTHQP